MHIGIVGFIGRGAYAGLTLGPAEILSTFIAAPEAQYSIRNQGSDSDITALTCTSAQSVRYRSSDLHCEEWAKSLTAHPGRCSDGYHWLSRDDRASPRLH